MITWLKKGAKHLLGDAFRCCYFSFFFFDGIEVLFPTYVKAESQLGPSMPHVGLDVAARCVSSRGGREEGSQNNAFLFYHSSYNASYRA